MSNDRYPRLPKLLGGRPCLNFVNTLDPRNAQPARDYLESYAGLLSWSQHAGVLSRARSAALAAQARRNARMCRRVAMEARGLRAALSRLLAAATLGEAIRSDDLEQLNRWLPPRRVTIAAGRPCWRSTPRPGLAAMLAPVAQDAAELLTSRAWSRVRECPGGGPCGWLFLDATKNGSRRYCSSNGCGNRARVARFLSRQRAEGRGRPRAAPSARRRRSPDRRQRVDAMKARLAPPPA